MEILFENEYTQNKAWAKDIYGYMYFKRPLMVVFHSLFTLFFILGLYHWLVWDQIMWPNLLSLPLFFGLSAYSYFINVKTVLKRGIEAHGGPLECATVVTDQEITLKASNGAESVLHYPDIKRAVQTKKYIYLWTKANLLYSFKKDAFTVGSAEEFLTLLKQKNIKVK